MSWITPKTDWTGSDGVRDTDFNRIEGNILDLYNTGKVVADLTIYVSTDGADAAGAGTSEAPYRTIMHALGTIPRNLNGKTVLVYIASGTYAEHVIINGYSNGKLVLAGYYGDAITINALDVDSSICEVRSLKITTTAGGIYITNGATFICNSTVSTNGGANGLRVLNGSSCRMYALLTVSNSMTAAIQVSGASTCYVLQIAGSGNENAIIAEEGSIVGYGSTNITANVAGFITRTGGRIYTGGQTSTPNY